MVLGEVRPIHPYTGVNARRRSAVHGTRGEGASARPSEPPTVGEIDKILNLSCFQGPAVPWPAGPLCAALGARAGPRSSPRAARTFSRLRWRLRAARPRVRAPGRDLVLSARACRARVCRSARGSRSRRGSSARHLRQKRTLVEGTGPLAQEAQSLTRTGPVDRETIRRLSNSLLSTAAARRRFRIRQNCLTHVVAAAFLFPTPYQTPTELPASRLQKHPGR